MLFQKAVPVHFFLIKRRVTIPRHKEQRNIRLFRCETCLFHAAFAQFALVTKSCRIYDNARAERMYLHRLVDRVGRRSRHIGDNGYLLSGKSVDECGFPAVCFSKYSYVQTAATRRLIQCHCHNFLFPSCIRISPCPYYIHIRLPAAARSQHRFRLSEAEVSLSLSNIMNVLVGGLLYLRIRNLLKLTVDQLHTDLFRLLARIILEIFF